MGALIFERHERPAVCEKHGEFTQTGMTITKAGRINWMLCGECSKEFEKKEEQERREKEEQARQARIERRFNFAGIPAAFRERGFDNYVVESDDMQNALDVTREFADNFWTRHAKEGTFLVFGGERGTGKSHLAIAAAKQVMREGTGMYLRVNDLIRRIRATWRKGSEESETEVFNLLAYDIDILVLDEIGVQRGTEDEQMTLFDILDARYAELRPTILLTNLSGKAFEDFLGPRITDRLRERAIFVPFKWQSWRGRKPSVGFDGQRPADDKAKSLRAKLASAL